MSSLRRCITRMGRKVNKNSAGPRALSIWAQWRRNRGIPYPDHDWHVRLYRQHLARLARDREWLYKKFAKKGGQADRFKKKK